MLNSPKQSDTKSGQPAVTLRGVFFSYDGIPVIENADITIAERESTCIVGPNGGGKSTLIKLILGLLKPTSGEIRVFGQPPERARLRIGYMPQHINYDPQYPVTVMDIVLMGRLGNRLGGPYSKTDRDVARAALDRIGLTDYSNRLFHALSGGQRQRVLIARALCCQPDILVLDEPTANVDMLVEEKLHDILKDLSTRMTIIMASHDLAFVSAVVKNVICVNRCVVMHPTNAITGEIISQVYGGDLCLIRHDIHTAEGGHSHG